MGLAQKAQDFQRDTVDTYNPATGKLHRTYELITQAEAEAMVEDSHQAFLSWRKTKLEDRAAIIQRIADLLERDKQEIAEMMTHQMGKPIAQSEAEVDVCVAICRYTAEQGVSLLQDETRPLDNGQQGIITYQPLGVILGMQPWNFPLYQCVRYSVAVIMAGNTTVFKHATVCHETGIKIQEIYEEAGLPKNVFLALITDSETVDTLIEHKKIRGVTYTGSAAIGAKIAEQAGKHLKKTVMELGGSDAYLVLDDVDMDEAVKTCVEGRTSNGGQICVGAKRFIIVESRYEEFKQKFVNAMEAIRYGGPMDRDNDMGPLVQTDLRKQLHEQVTESIQRGATLLCGGEIPSGEGAYYPATVLENIPENCPAYDDELFGPVASLFKVKDEEEAIALSNSHRYGLGGGILCNDKEKAIRIARDELDTGMVNINQYGTARPNMPFGGVKDSGYGREHGGFGIREFVNAKSIYVG